jgi:hypothetical protein
VNSGQTFPLVSNFSFGYSQDRPIIVHRFGDLDAKCEQRFQVGMGPRKFQFRRANLNYADRHALADFWEEVKGLWSSFMYTVPNADGTSSPTNVIFENTPLSLQYLRNAVQVGLTFVEIFDPSTAPTYAVNDTCLRFPSSALQTALLSQVQQIIPLVHIRVREAAVPDIYLSDRRVTIGSQLYLPRLLDIGEPGSGVLLSQDIRGSADNVRFTFGNADRVMTQLANDTDLKYAQIDLCLFHVNSGILLQLWSGFIQSFVSDGTPQFSVQCSDGLYQITQAYPTRTVSRTCWKTIGGYGCPYAGTGKYNGNQTANKGDWDPSVAYVANDVVVYNGTLYASLGDNPAGSSPDVNPAGWGAVTCDYYFDSPNGCQAHGMDPYFGGHPAQPQGVWIKDNSTGIWGFGRNRVNATSIVSDSVLGNALPEIWCNDDGDPGKAFWHNCMIMAGRDESSYYDALGIVGAGPIGQYTGMLVYQNADGYRYIIAPMLDGQTCIGFKVDSQLRVTSDTLAGLVQVPGGDPQTNSFGLQPDNGPERAAGTAWVEIRRTDPAGIQPTTVDEHQMQVPISQGLAGRRWDETGVDYWTPGLTNPFWIAISSFLRALGLPPSVTDSDAAKAAQLAKFVLTSVYTGLGTGAAEIADTLVAPLVGTDATEEQFRFQGTLAQQKPFRDWLTEILTCGLGYYTWEFGKLKLGCRINASATDAFTLGNILFQSLRLEPIDAAFEHLIIDFADQSYQYQANTAEYQDKSHAAYYGRSNAPLTARRHLLGCATLSQALRLAATLTREELGGVTPAEWLAARNASWKTTLLALSTEVGQVASMTHPDVPGGYGDFRIQSWRLNKDWSIDITAKTVTPSMYDLDVGPKPVDVVPDPLPGMFYPIPLSPAWAPYQLQAASDDALFPNEYNFDCDQECSYLADGSAALVLNITGKQPVNAFSPGSWAPIVTGGSISQSTTGGSLPGGKTFRVAVCAFDSSGCPTPPSNILIIQTPAGTNTNQFTINGILWPTIPNLAHYVVFVSDVDDLICAQQMVDGEYSGALTAGDNNTYTPGSITVTGPLARSTWALPSPYVAKTRIKAKLGIHFGVLGGQVSAVSPNTLVSEEIADLLGGGFDPSNPQRGLIIVGRQTGSVPFASYQITSWDPATGTMGVTPDPSSVVQVGDIFVISTRLDTTDNSADETKYTDSGFKNQTNGYGGLTPHEVQNQGRILRVIAGTGRGETRRLLDNGATSLAWDLPLLLDQTSVVIVEAGVWNWMGDVVDVQNADPLHASMLPVPTTNFFEQPVLVLAVTVGTDGVESSESDAPVRMNWIVGQGPQTVTVTEDTEEQQDNTALQIDPAQKDQDINVTLVPADSIVGMRTRRYKRVSGGSRTVTLTPRMGDTIEGSADPVVLPNASDYIDLYGIGTHDWKVAASNVAPFAGGGGTQYDKSTYGYGIDQDLVVRTDACPPLIITDHQEIDTIYATPRVAPIGQDVLIDIRFRSTGLSLLSAPLHVPADSLDVQKITDLLQVAELFEGDVLITDVDQVGTDNPGSTLVVKIKSTLEEAITTGGLVDRFTISMDGQAFSADVVKSGATMRWYFGSGANATGNSAAHSYPDASTKTIMLTSPDGVATWSALSLANNSVLALQPGLFLKALNLASIDLSNNNIPVDEINRILAECVASLS